MFSPVSIHVNKRTITQRNNTAAELLVKMERDFNMMGNEPFHVDTDHRLLVNIVEHLDASTLRSMQRIVVKQQLYSISQFQISFANTYRVMTTWLTYSHDHRLCEHQQSPGSF